jgi:hypothetical protein
VPVSFDLSVKGAGYNKKYEKLENLDWKKCQNFSQVFLALISSNIP